jgi:hypothetical protein
MRKSLLFLIILLAIAGCGDDPVGPEKRTVQATLILEYSAWDQEGEARRYVEVWIYSTTTEPPEIRLFADLPQEGPVVISTILPCFGDNLDHLIGVHASGTEVSSSASVYDLTCSEEPQSVFFPTLPWPTVGF